MTETDPAENGQPSALLRMLGKRAAERSPSVSPAKADAPGRSEEEPTKVPLELGELGEDIGRAWARRVRHHHPHLCEAAWEREPRRFRHFPVGGPCARGLGQISDHARVFQVPKAAVACSLGCCCSMPNAQCDQAEQSAQAQGWLTTGALLPGALWFVTSWAITVRRLRRAGSTSTGAPQPQREAGVHGRLFREDRLSCFLYLCAHARHPGGTPPVAVT